MTIQDRLIDYADRIIKLSEVLPESIYSRLLMIPALETGFECWILGVQKKGSSAWHATTIHPQILLKSQTKSIPESKIPALPSALPRSGTSPSPAPPRRGSRSEFGPGGQQCF